MSDFKLEFTLKQHTPIIHFQSDQKGATLRATELKPKLDRFLLEQFEKEGIDYSSFLISGQERALDYKVKIDYQGNNQKDYPKPFVKRGADGYVAPYFADGVSIEHEKGIDINLVIQSFNEELLKYINKYIKYFFTSENFGTRQSKGFGSYHLFTLNKQDFEVLLENHDNHVFKLTKGANNPKKALAIVDTFYRELKSGINYPNYKKSLLFQYMCTQDKGWEKKWIKEQFPTVVYGRHTPVNCEPRAEYYYIRALLGLAEHNEYYPNGQINRLQVKISSTERDKIERFKSPITFKIFEGSIYLIYNKSYEDILNKEFQFSLTERNRQISTPKSFDMYKFLKFVETKMGTVKELK